MRIWIICIIFAFIYAAFPAAVSADGCVIKKSAGDWTWLDENSQQAFINYQNGIEKLIIAVDIEKHDSDAVWIVPVPGNPKDVAIDITSELPTLFGDEVMSKAKIALRERIKTSCTICALGQLWAIVPSAIIAPRLWLVSSTAAGIEGSESSDSVSVETHIEKKGMVSELITAKTAQALYNYLSDKGLKIEQGSIPVLDSYMAKDYVFVVSWLSSRSETEENTDKRGIFITFPTKRIYYPLLPTSVYGKEKVPVNIRVLGHVKPRIYSELRPYSSVRYITKRNHSTSPDISYFLSPELQDFYGSMHAWENSSDYTRIVIDAPAEIFRDDILMEAERPLGVSLALLAIRHPVGSGILLYILSVGIISALAGGIAGLICFRRFGRYALIGLANIATLIALIVVFLFTDGKDQNLWPKSKIRFVYLLFVSLAILMELFVFSILLSDHISSTILEAIVGAIIATAVSILSVAIIVVLSPSLKFVLLFSAIFLVLTFAFWTSSEEALGLSDMDDKNTEAWENLYAIWEAQESYFSDNGVYLACPPNPAGWSPGPNASKSVPWDKGVAQWDAIGFKPAGKVCHQYEVTVISDGKSFVASARGDLDEDVLPSVLEIGR